MLCCDFSQRYSETRRETLNFESTISNVRHLCECQCVVWKCCFMVYSHTCKIASVLAPKLPDSDGSSGPTRVIYFTNQSGLDSTKTQYRVMVNRSFFDDTSNGALHERGVIVMDAEEGTYRLIAINNQS